jgi:hypothetical protein
MLIFSHFHKDFPFNFDCKWIIPCYAGNIENDIQGHQIFYNLDKFCNVSNEQNNFHIFRKYYKNVSENDFIKAMGAEATLYHVYKNGFLYNSEYLGFTSYRRYLLIDSNLEYFKIKTNKKNINYLTSSIIYEKLIDNLKKYDVICNKFRSTDKAFPYENFSIEQQYLYFEIPEYWNLFLEGINNLYPKYYSSIDWFKTSNTCPYEGIFIMKKDLMHIMLDEFFNVLEYVWQKCKEVLPLYVNNYNICKDELPFRYPGYLGERFFPFFCIANNLSIYQVPLIIIENDSF